MHDEGIKKLYYSIGEVSEQTELEQHVLRYWETEFDELAPRKNRAGRRVYTAEDIAVVERIQHLLRDEKYTIEGAKQVLAHEANHEAIRSEASETRVQLLELKTFLEKLLHAI